MRKTILNFFALFTILWVWPVMGQEVVSTSGDYHENANGSVSWTLGETVIETFAAGDFQLTQGFQQGDISVSTLVNDPSLNFAIDAYPNPTSGYVNLELDLEETKGISYMLLNMGGRLLEKRTVEGPNSRIALHHLETGVYFVQVIKDGSLLKTFKIVKQ